MLFHTIPKHIDHSLEVKIKNPKKKKRQVLTFYAWLVSAI